MIFKTGAVVYNLHPRVEDALVDGGPIDDIFRELAHRHCVITSVRDEGHSWNSYHYYGRAFDCRTNDMDYESSIEAEQLMIEALGLGWHVELEYIGTPNEHIHAEFRGS